MSSASTDASSTASASAASASTITTAVPATSIFPTDIKVPSYAAVSPPSLIAWNTLLSSSDSTSSPAQQPLSSLGLLSDIQCSDHSDLGHNYAKTELRYYRKAMEATERAMKDMMECGVGNHATQTGNATSSSSSTTPITHVLHLGDLIDGANRKHQHSQRVLDEVLKRLPAPAKERSQQEVADLMASSSSSSNTTPFPSLSLYHLIGNHELYNYPRSVWANLLGMGDLSRRSVEEAEMREKVNNGVGLKGIDVKKALGMEEGEELMFPECDPSTAAAPSSTSTSSATLPPISRHHPQRYNYPSSSPPSSLFTSSSPLYYSFTTGLLQSADGTTSEKYRFLMLDSFDRAVNGYDEPDDHAISSSTVSSVASSSSTLSQQQQPHLHPHTHQAYSILHRNNPTGHSSGYYNPLGDTYHTKRFVSFNGGIGEGQMRWILSEINEAKRLQQYIVLCSHVPFDPRCTQDSLQIWNQHELMKLIEKCGENVVACLHGHDHAGGHFSDPETGVHHHVCEAILTTPEMRSCHARLDLYEDRIELRGVDLMKSVEMRVPERAKRLYGITHAAPAPRLVGIELNPGPPSTAASAAQHLFTSGVHTIFSFLPTQDWLYSGRLCRTWRAAALSTPCRRTEFDLSGSNPPHINGLLLSLKQSDLLHHHMTSLILSQGYALTPKTFSALIKRFTRLESLDVTLGSADISPYGMAGVKPAFGDDDEGEETSATSTSSRLQRVVLGCNNWGGKDKSIVQTVLQHLTTLCPHLHSLTLDHLGSSNVITPLREMKSLSSLHLTQYSLSIAYDFGEEHVVYSDHSSTDAITQQLRTIASLPSLTELTLDDDKRNSQTERVLHAAQAKDIKFTQIQKLTMSHYAFLNAESLPLIHSVTPSLHLLEPRSFHLDSTRHLCDFPQLDSLHFNEKPLGSESPAKVQIFITQHLSSCTNLTRLSFNGKYVFQTSEEWMMVYSSVRGLKSLSFEAPKPMHLLEAITYPTSASSSSAAASHGCTRIRNLVLTNTSFAPTTLPLLSHFTGCESLHLTGRVFLATGAPLREDYDRVCSYFDNREVMPLLEQLEIRIGLNPPLLYDARSQEKTRYRN